MSTFLALFFENMFYIALGLLVVGIVLNDE